MLILVNSHSQWMVPECFHWYLPNPCIGGQIMAAVQPGCDKWTWIPICHLFPQ